MMLSESSIVFTGHDTESLSRVVYCLNAFDHISIRINDEDTPRISTSLIEYYEQGQPKWTPGLTSIQEDWLTVSFEKPSDISIGVSSLKIEVESEFRGKERHATIGIDNGTVGASILVRQINQ